MTVFRLMVTIALGFVSAASWADVPFAGERGKQLDTACGEDIWDDPASGFLFEFVRVPRDQVVGFALYTHDHGVLKISAQLYPLKTDEPREVRLEFQENGQWREVATAPVLYPGWSAHFRIGDWDGTRDVPYRVCHGERARFEGLIRKDPIDKDVIVVASLSCDSNADRGDRDAIVEKLRQQDPDLLFFAGDQSYDHQQHTAAWLLWGHQFREVIKDRPVVTIPDDHDIGQGNLWGEGGIVADSTAGDSGGYYYPAEYIRMVERCQTWHLPDPVDPRPVAQGIGVYFTRLRVGGVDFAVIEDRKFKSGPKGKIPQMGPRPDHIRTPGYDPKKVDLPELSLLGDRQLAFLNDWGQDWTGASMKAVLSQTAFCGAVHLHGSREDRLLADLDCNGWPQTGRRKALEAIRRALACHLCGDQHLSVVVKHGIDGFRDGPYAFTNPATVNSYYARWWHPEDERPGANPVVGSPLPWTGDYLDGLYNHITMIAYANPGFGTIKEMRQRQRDPEAPLADGYGLIRFNKKTRETRFECWPRYADLAKGDAAQYPGWPVSFAMRENDGRKVHGHLPELEFVDATDPVVQVVGEQDAELLYTLRIQGNRFRPHVFAPGKYTVKAGRNKPDAVVLKGLTPAEGDADAIPVTLQ
ncbi:MAG: metallophosphoesterase [Planctomycetes bacterium]|nr:metallophosphoesterase [Planctomycetota bacterium]